MTRLSSLQFAMLETFGTKVYMSISQAQAYDQRPFRSMLIQQWVAFKPGRGFHITQKGINAQRDFHAGNIGRKNPTLPLTAYFDPTAYGLKPAPKKAPVHVMQKRGQAA